MFKARSIWHHSLKKILHMFSAAKLPVKGLRHVGSQFVWNNSERVQNIKQATCIWFVCFFVVGGWPKSN